MNENDTPTETSGEAPAEALTSDPRWGDLDADPALASAILEIEEHLADNGWDQPGRLYALVETGDLVRQEPQLAAAMGLDAAAEQGSLTAVEQDQLDPAQPLEAVLESIEWPPGVVGCAAMVERFVLPPGSDADLPDDPVEARAFARDHPDRQEVRIVAGATRSGSTYCALRLRSHDDDASVVGGIDLVPGLLTLLRDTLTDPNDPAVHLHDEHDDAALEEPSEENP